MELKKRHFVRLGCRDSWLKSLKVSADFTLLNHAFKSGLPVPNGIILLQQGWQLLQQAGIVSVMGKDVVVHSADEFLECFGLHKRREAVALHPSCALELSGPPQFNKEDDHLLIEGIVAIWQKSAEARFSQCDIWLYQAVTPLQMGRAITKSQPFDQLLFDDQESPLPALRGWQQPTATIAWQRRLQQLLRGVRRSFSLHGKTWDIAWCDDGQICWLTGVRPIG